MIEALEGSPLKRESCADADKVDVLTSWHRVDPRTREDLRCSFLPELISGYEKIILFRIAYEILSRRVETEESLSYKFNNLSVRCYCMVFVRQMGFKPFRPLAN
ncbi:hypothetical protein ACH5RR_010683 [Cinchona calisaya]|uniref:Maturase K n=1 Tax=Cinchona calisaya TaxID=153742 RepID=A0ABD3AJK0_9GENT